MTDHHDPLDDLASAHIDGQTTDAEAARIAADPELVARVERLAAAREALRGSDAPVDEVRRDGAIAAALTAFDDGATSEGTADDLLAAQVTAIAPRRRSHSSRRTLQVVGIAAAVILLALSLPLLGRLDSGSDDTAATHFEATGKSLDQSGAAAGGPGEATTTLRSAAAPPDLGSFEALPALAEAVRTQLTANTTAALESSPTAAQDMTSPAATEPAPCTAEVQDADGPPLYLALAELEGKPVVIVVRAATDGTRTLTVLDRVKCTPVTTGRL